MFYQISEDLDRGDVEKNKQIKYKKQYYWNSYGLDNIKLEIKNQKLKKNKYY